MDLLADNSYEQARRLDLGGPVPTGGLRRLGAILARSEKGFPHDLRTPFWEDLSRSEVILKFEREIRESPILSHIQMDMEEKAKVGPMSIMLPYKDRMTDIVKYFSNPIIYPNEESFRYASDILRSKIPIGSLRPKEPDTAFNEMPKDTNLGLPELTRNRGSAPAYLTRAIAARSIEDFYPAVVGWRGQQSGTDIPKQRVVWMMDHAETILSSMYMGALLKVQQRMIGHSAWNTPEDVDIAMTRIIDKAITRGLKIYSFDYSGFDHSISRRYIEEIFNIFGDWFVPEVRMTIDLMMEVFSTVPLVVPWDVLSQRSGAVPSGSGWTGGFDSNTNEHAANYAADRLGLEIVDGEFMGDDAVVLFSDNPEATDIANVMLELGLEMSESKQHISFTNAHFLQRMHDSEYRKDGICVGVRSPFRFISGATSYERFRSNWNKFLGSARLIIQANNCMHHPYFEDLVRVCMNEDELLRSGMDVVEIFRLAGGSEKIRSVLGLASFPFNVSDPRGVENFKFTRIARALS